MTLFPRETRLRPLRPRQSNAIDAIRQAIRDGHRRIVLQAPTGFGKTLTSAHIIVGSLDKQRRPLFTCPAVTLVDQTLRSFEAEGINGIGVIQAQHERTDWTQPLQIASVQTLIRRALPDVDFILIDEVHENFKGLNERLDSDEWKGKIAIGLSATPWAKGMGLRWTKLIIAATIQELIDEGHLSPFLIYVPDHELDRSKLKVKAGEFVERSASEAMSDAAIIGDVVRTWRERGPGEKTFMFCVNRAHAKEQMLAFHEAGIPFGYIDADTPILERRDIFKQMQHGDIAGIASVGCLIRGVDEDVRCIIDCQPTKSLMRHVQKWGRGLRTADGKDTLIGLDHAGNTLALGMVTNIHITELDTHKPGEKGDTDHDEKMVPKPKKCAKCKALIPPGRAVCAQCGEAIKRASGVESRDGELILFSGQEAPKVKKPAKDEKQEWYGELLGLAEERGYNRGWVSHRYREKFGVWPVGLEHVPLMPSRKVRNFDHERRVAYQRGSSDSKPVSAVS